MRDPRKKALVNKYVIPNANMYFGIEYPLI